MRLTVRSTVNESQIEAANITKGRDLFKIMSKSFCIQEHWYFGLMYEDNGHEVWIDESKKTLKDYSNSKYIFQYKIKLFPEDVQEELIEQVTIEHFYYEVRKNILNDDIYCPSDMGALLASYSLQVKFGDYHADTLSKVAKYKLLPPRVLQNHSMDITEWQDSIVNMWKKHTGLDSEEAMLEYLKLAQNLDMYGVKYFNIWNKKGSEVLLGVCALGLNIYLKEDKINPQISFPWSEIKNLKFKDRKFCIKTVDKTSKDFNFITESPRSSKSILNLGVGNHIQYVKRRKPEPQEITALKEKNKDIRRKRNQQKMKYNKEKSAREEAEDREIQYKKQIELMQEEMNRKNENLMQAERTIKQLQQQLMELQKSKEELEEQRHQLEEMMQRLEHSKNLEAAERQKLEDEIRAKHDEVQRIQDEVAMKDAETKRLQDEIEQNRLREEQAKEEARLELLEEEKRKKQEYELQVLQNANNELPEMQEVNEQLKDQLKMLQNKLDETRSQEQESNLDKIHRINVTQGRDKYRTLADIRRGNTVRRVELFENL